MACDHLLLEPTPTRSQIFYSRHTSTPRAFQNFNHSQHNSTMRSLFHGIRLSGHWLFVHLIPMKKWLTCSHTETHGMMQQYIQARASSKGLHNGLGIPYMWSIGARINSTGNTCWRSSQRIFPYAYPHSKEHMKRTRKHFFFHCSGFILTNIQSAMIEGGLFILTKMTWERLKMTWRHSTSWCMSMNMRH